MFKRAAALSEGKLVFSPLFSTFKEDQTVDVPPVGYWDVICRKLVLIKFSLPLHQPTTPEPFLEGSESGLWTYLGYFSVLLLILKLLMTSSHRIFLHHCLAFDYPEEPGVGQT